MEAGSPTRGRLVLLPPGAALPSRPQVCSRFLRRAFLDRRLERPLARRRQQNAHHAAFHARRALGDGDVLERVAHAQQLLAAEVLIRHLAAAEAEQKLHPVAGLEELARLADLAVDVAVIGTVAEAELLDGGDGGLLLRLVLFLVLLILELAVVENTAHRWLGLGGDLDQVELRLLREANRLVDRHDADLLTSSADQTDLRGADLAIDSVCLFGRGNETWASTAIRQMTSFLRLYRGEDYTGAHSSVN